MLATDTVQAAQANIRRWRANPSQFVVEQFGVEPDPWQHELLQAFADPTKPRISLQACVGPGKTAGLAWCGLNFLSCYGDIGEHPKGVGLAVTWDNLKDNLWPELAKWMNRSEFLRTAFTWNKERIFANDHPETWFLSARSWSKTATAEEQGKTLAGLHSKYVLVLIDESSTIPTTVQRAADQVLSSCVFGKVVQSGNPSSLEGMLYAAATVQRHLWHVIRITGDPNDPKAWVHAKRLGPGPKAWAQEQIDTYGRDNPWVMYSVLGQFPPSSINSLLSLEDVQRAMERQLQPAEYEHMQKRIGVDVARFGDDRTVLAPRQGLQWFKPVVMRGARTTDIAARVMVGREKFGSKVELIDDTGHWGHGVIDNLIAAGATPHAVVFHAPALNPRYKNRRAEMWITMADAVKGGAALPNEGELIRELTAPTYTFANGVFQLEDKDQIKKRIGTSPDLADAFALTYALPEMPDLPDWMKAQSHKALTEYDPLARVS